MKKPLGLALASLFLLLPLAAQTKPGGPLSMLAELSAGPLMGIDTPLKGCSGGLLLGFAARPFEAGLRAGLAYDAGLMSGSLRLDLELGLGGGLRAIVGGLVPLGEPSLGDPLGGALPVPVVAADWPDRFGLATTLFVLPLRLLGAQALVDAELVYTDYRFAQAAAGSASVRLSGAAAFAAGVEASLALRLRWSP